MLQYSYSIPYTFYVFDENRLCVKSAVKNVGEPIPVVLARNLVSYTPSEILNNNRQYTQVYCRKIKIDIRQFRHSSPKGTGNSREVCRLSVASLLQNTVAIINYCVIIKIMIIFITK